MTIQSLANKIPDEVRSLRLLTDSDPIDNAVSSLNNEHMLLLLNIWKEFIYSEHNICDCPMVNDNIRTNFKQMKPYLVELENEYLQLKTL